MKSTWLLLITVLLLSCNQVKNKSQDAEVSPVIVTKAIENFNWLLGDWKRLNEEDGKETFENWEKVSATEYAGIGFTLQKGDTISKEHIQLLKVNQNWDLVVSLGSGSEPVTFKGFTHAETEFSCENIANDFPNIIKYWKNGDHLNAMISGGDIEVQFEFEKVNE